MLGGPICLLKLETARMNEVRQMYAYGCVCVIYIYIYIAIYSASV